MWMASKQHLTATKTRERDNFLCELYNRATSIYGAAMQFLRSRAPNDILVSVGHRFDGMDSLSYDVWLALRLCSLRDEAVSTVPHRPTSRRGS
jgi:hypothetical protein